MGQRPVDNEIVHRSPAPEIVHPVSVWVPLLPPGFAGEVVSRFATPGLFLNSVAPMDAIRAIE